MFLLLLVNIHVEYSEMPLLNVVGDATYGLLVQFIVSQLQYVMQSNGLDCQKQFLPIKKNSTIFVSVV